MRGVQVDTDKEKGEIIMAQPNPMEDDSVIIISPDQVDILIGWLQEAKKEFLGK